jgi:hypothetical protein
MRAMNRSIDTRGFDVRNGRDMQIADGNSSPQEQLLHRSAAMVSGHAWARVQRVCRNYRHGRWTKRRELRSDMIHIGMITKANNASATTQATA